jgi:hypothetical protein
MVLSDIIANLHSPFAILMLFVAAVCFAGYGYEGYRGYRARKQSGFLWVVFVVVGILAIIEWLILVFT